MKFDEVKKKSAGGSLPLDEVPASFIGIVRSEETKTFKKEGKEGEGLYWRIALLKDGDYGEFTQKYTPFHLSFIADAMESLGYDDTEAFLGKPHLFKQKSFKGSSSKPRWLPIKPAEGDAAKALIKAVNEQSKLDETEEEEAEEESPKKKKPTEAPPKKKAKPEESDTSEPEEEDEEEEEEEEEKPAPKKPEGKKK